ncbi:hypothetical protein B0H16DRAFT_1449494 [Mycena metata]|uniref:NAD(P)-binding domain-containing protein n=1 Tax=Mycena metata TaxID=1033252 RepID=A0AAD7NW21_9AGAR|nr:hypothetical protein B0H16DRAFT_1449494 [Mycena metata]
MSQTALILGATGQTGGFLLKELLASPHFTRVWEFGRRTTSLDSLPTGKDKLEQKTIDFEKPEEAGLREGKWDVVFIALGTTAKAAGSSEAFERIDREYVINAARAAKGDHPQRLIYVSSGGANSKSRFLYPRSKGLTEEGLASLGYADTIVFRPGLLTATKRPETRIAETIAGYITPILSFVTSNAEIKISTLAKSLVKAGQLGTAGLPPAVGATQDGTNGARFTLVTNAGALALARD